MSGKHHPTTPARKAVGLLATATSLIAAAALSQPLSAAAAPAGSGSDHSAQRLAAISADIDQSGVDGISWYTDAAAQRVVVTADESVSASELARLRRAAGSDAGSLRVERTHGVFRALGSAGSAIYGGGYRCSLGFNVVKGGVYYFLTAGHCGKVVNTWYANSSQTTLIGPTEGYSFPGNDYALVRYANPAVTHPGGYTVGDAFVGEAVKRTGSTTGTHSGTVTALNVTVRYQGSGKVGGLIQTTVCAEPGDSGGAMYDGTKALGLTSGGSGDCSRGGTTFFQPVREAANAYGVSVF